MVDVGVFPVPEACDVYLLADVGLAQHSLADHAVGRYRDGGRRHAETHRLELVDAVLQRRTGEIVGILIEEFLAQGCPHLVVVGDIERQYDIVAVESERRQGIHAVEQRIGGGGRCAVGIGIEVDGVAFEHQHPFAVAHAFPYKARVVVGIGQYVLVEFFHAAQVVLAEVGRTFPAEREPHLAAENAAYTAQREFVIASGGLYADLHVQVGSTEHLLCAERDGVLLHQFSGILIVIDVFDVTTAIGIVLGKITEFAIELLECLLCQTIALVFRKSIYRQRLAAVGDLHGEGLVGGAFGRYAEVVVIACSGSVHPIAGLRYQITQVGCRGDGRLVTVDCSLV